MNEKCCANLKWMKQKTIDTILQNKTLFQNFSFLTILQIATLIFPLITYPYLIRILGKELYGTVIYAQAIVAYFAIIVNFGFNISATKDVSVHRDDPKKLSEIVSSVYIIKVILFLLCFINFSVITYAIPSLRQHYLLLLLTYGVVLGEVLLPVWFYQGIEKMNYMTYVSIASKLFFTICIFIFIHSADDYLYMPILLSLGAVVGGIISFVLVFKTENVHFVLPKLSAIHSYLKRTFPFFLSRLSAVAYSQTNTVIIGSYLGMTEVAYYDLAKKLTNLLMIPNSIINTGVYPKIAREKSLGFVKKFFYIRLAIAGFLFMCLLLGGKLAIYLLGGESMLVAYPYVIVYGVYILISAVSYYVGGTVLVSFNHEKIFNRSVYYSFFLYVALMGLLILFYKITLPTIIAIFLLVEGTLALYRYYFCKKYKLL